MNPFRFCHRKTLALIFLGALFTSGNSLANNDGERPERGPYRLYNKYWGETFHRAGLTFFGAPFHDIVAQVSNSYLKDLDIRRSFLLPQLKIFTLRREIESINKHLAPEGSQNFSDPAIEYYSLHKKLIDFLLATAAVQPSLLGRDINEDELLLQSLNIELEDETFAPREIDYDRASVLKFSSLKSNEQITKSPDGSDFIESNPKWIHVRSHMWMTFLHQLIVSNNQAFRMKERESLKEYRKAVPELELVQEFVLRYLHLLKKSLATAGANATWIDFGNQMRAFAEEQGLDLSWQTLPLYQSGDILQWISRMMHEVLLDLEQRMSASHERYLIGRLENQEEIDRLSPTPFDRGLATQFALEQKKKLLEGQLIIAELSIYNNYTASIAASNDVYAGISRHHWWPQMFQQLLSETHEEAWKAHQEQLPEYEREP